MPAQALDHRFVVHDSIRAIDSLEWSSLELPSPFLTHGWLWAVETMAIDPPQFRCLLMYEGQTLVGALIGEIVTADRRRGCLNSNVFGRVAGTASRLGLNLEPALVCLPFEGYGSSCLVRKSAQKEDRQKITSCLLNAWSELARVEKLPIAFCGLTKNDDDFSRDLESSGFHRSTHLPVARLELPWGSFSDYIASVRTKSASAAKDIRRERNRLAKSEIYIARFVPKPSDDARLLALAKATLQKHGSKPFPYAGPYFSTLANALGDDFFLYGAWKGKQLVAFSLMLRNNDNAWGTHFGCDYDACGRDHTYFNIVFNRPIEDAIENGLSNLYFGRGLYELKCRRGCELIPSYLFYRARNRLSNVLVEPTFKLRSRYYEHKSRRTISAAKSARSTRQ